MIQRFLLALLLVCCAAAQDDSTGPRLRVRVEPESTVLVGQPVRVVVDVLVSTWLTRHPGANFVIGGNLPGNVPIVLQKGKRAMRLL